MIAFLECFKLLQLHLQQLLQPQQLLQLQQLPQQLLQAQLILQQMPIVQQVKPQIQLQLLLLKILIQV